MRNGGRLGGSLGGGSNGLPEARYSGPGASLLGHERPQAYASAHALRSGK